MTHALRRRLDRMPTTGRPPTTRDLATPWSFLYWLARSQAGRVALGAALGIGWMITLAGSPWVLARAVDAGLVGDDPAALVTWSLVLLAIAVLTAVLGIGRHRTMSKIRMDASFRAVRATVQHSSRLGGSLPRQVAAGEVVTVGIADVYTVAQALTVTGPGIGAVVAYATVAVVLFTIAPLLAAVVLAGVPLIVIMVGPLLRRIEHTGTDYRIEQGRLTTRLVDALAGLRVLNGLGGKPFVAERYRQQSQQLVARGYRVAGPAGWVGALSAGLPALFLAAVVWLSARMAAAEMITIGDLVAVHGYVAMLVVPVSSFIEGAGDLARARVAGRRIIDLLKLPVDHDRLADPVPLPATCGPLADPTSGMIIRPGLLTAVVAPRSADALAVLERLGSVGTHSDATWDGVRVDQVSRAELRRRLLLADNDAEIFAGTVRSTVAGRATPADDQVRTALRVAVADDVVDALPGGLDATIAAGGRDLSGGQRQRIRLARAVCSAPDVLLAVDPTSAVDANTEAAMIDRLHEARTDRTTVLSTTSPLVLDRADEVIMLVDGRVAATGTHQTLLRSNPTYRALVTRSQGETEQWGDDG